MDKKTRRIFYSVITIILILMETAIVIFIHDDFIRPYIGDIVFVFILYAFLMIWLPRTVKLLPLYLFLLLTGVEIMQYLDVIRLLGLDDITFLRLLVGSTFDIKDIVCYAIGCLILYIYQIKSWRICRK